MTKREALGWSLGSLAQTLTAARSRDDTAADLRPPEEPQATVPEAVRTLGFFLALSALVTAGSVIGRGYAYSDVVALLAVQLGTAVLIWRIPWRRVDEAWLLTIIGVQIVYVAALVTLTGGGDSPYFSLYAPVLALAGWHLRQRYLAVALAFLAVTELWRALAVERTAAIDQLIISLPMFALVAIFANLVSARAMVSLAGNRRDQLRTAGTLNAVRAIGELPPDHALATVIPVIAETFEADVAIAGPSLEHENLDSHACRDPLSRDHIRLPMTQGDVRLGHLALCRSLPFSASERRLTAIVADSLGRAIESRRLFAQVRSEAECDQLTGLLNRGAFDRDLSSAVERALRDGTALAVYLLDLDGFQGYNDTEGHAQGDLALQRVARALLAQVPERSQVYRFGGDEFVVIGAGIAGLEALLLAERLRLSSMARIMTDQGHRLTVSVGMATCRGPECTAEVLLREADEAMNAEKSERRERLAAP